MPKPIMVSCDSACDLSEEMRQRYAIQVTSMYIHQDGKVFRDGIDITPDDIYATYDEKGVFAHHLGHSAGGIPCVCRTYGACDGNLDACAREK